MEIKELPDKEFKIIILKLFRDLQENIHKQFNDIRRTMQEQNEKSPRDEKRNKKNPKILVLRNSMTELKYESASIRLNQTEVSISFNINQLKLSNQRNKKKKKMKRNEENLWNLWYVILRNSVEVPEVEVYLKK